MREVRGRERETERDRRRERLEGGREKGRPANFMTSPIILLKSMWNKFPERESERGSV